MPQVAETKTAEVQPTAEDFIQPDKWYSPTQIEEILSISALAVTQAPFRQKTGAGEVHGDSLLAWIKKNKIPYHITPYAQTLHDKKRQQQQRETELFQKESEALESNLSAANIIDVGETYTATEIDQLLSIPPFLMRQASKMKNGALKAIQGKTDVEFLGGDFLKWLATKPQIQYVPTARAIEIYENKNKASTECKGTIDDAIALNKRFKQQEARELEECRLRDWGLYCTLIAKSELTDDPLTEVEVKSLAEVMMDLEISHDQVSTARDFMRKAAKQNKLLKDLQEANKLRLQTREQYMEMRQRHKFEEQERWRKKSRADGYHRQCSLAHNELMKLQREQPDLFQYGSPYFDVPASGS